MVPRASFGPCPSAERKKSAVDSTLRCAGSVLASATLRAVCLRKLPAGRRSHKSTDGTNQIQRVVLARQQLLK